MDRNHARAYCVLPHGLLDRICGFSFQVCCVQAGFRYERMVAVLIVAVLTENCSG